MSAWLEGGKPAILEALAAACDTIDEQARAELEARDRKHNELLNEIQALKSRAAEVDRLKQENRSLEAEIRRLREGQEEDRQLSPKKRTILGELSPNKPASKRHASRHKIQSSDEVPDAVATKYTKLFSEAKMLKVKHEDALEKLHDCRRKLRERTDALKQWANIADTRQQTIQKLKARLKSLPLTSDGVSTAQTDLSGDTTSADDETLASVAPKEPNPVSSCGNERSLSPTPFVELGSATTPWSPECVVSEPPTRLEADGISGDITDDVAFEDETAPADDMDLPPHLDHTAEKSRVSVKAEPSSDAPVFVSTRTARKRKHEEEGPEDGRLRRIKSEHSSSSGPEIIAEAGHFSTAESIDFEEEVHVPTPRKRRALRRGVLVNLDTDSEASPHSGMGIKLHPHRSSAPRDAFSSMARSFNATRKTKKPASSASFASPLTLGVMDLADDGEAGSDSKQQPVVKGRLDALLNNSPSVNATSPISRAASRRVETPRPVTSHNGDDTAWLPPSRLLVPSGTSKSRGRETTAMIGHQLGVSPCSLPTVARDRGPKRPSILRDDMPRGRSATKDEVPLRDRPIERLRPEDFKPNPKYNDGLTYVYDEVVRGKDARAALSACTDPKCCGKTFRRFAEAEKKALGSSVAIRAEDVSLMEKYLGDQAWELGSMTREEKEETWLLAKTWELANKFGKHRQRYSRMPTPPGFWNVDFPSTQERAEERRQAEEIRSALVHERYREAMRSGGSWLFRDEEPR